MLTEACWTSCSICTGAIIDSNFMRVFFFFRDGKGDISNWEKETSFIMLNPVRLGDQKNNLKSVKDRFMCDWFCSILLCLYKENVANYFLLCYWMINI